MIEKCQLNKMSSNNPVPVFLLDAFFQVHVLGVLVVGGENTQKMKEVVKWPESFKKAAVPH